MSGCLAIYGDPSTDECYFCCRYEGHPGDHEEWVDKAGDPTDPIKGRMTFAWPAVTIGDAGASSATRDGVGQSFGVSDQDTTPRR